MVVKGFMAQASTWACGLKGFTAVTVAIS